MIIKVFQINQSPFLGSLNSVSMKTTIDNDKIKICIVNNNAFILTVNKQQ